MRISVIELVVLSAIACQEESGVPMSNRASSLRLPRFPTPTNVDLARWEAGQAHFEKLKVQWYRETQRLLPLSVYVPQEWWEGPAGMEIQKMGREALPFVIREIEQGNLNFSYPAAQITGSDVNVDGAGGEDSFATWGAWWATHRHDPVWNPYLNEP